MKKVYISPSNQEKIYNNKTEKEICENLAIKLKEKLEKNKLITYISNEADIASKIEESIKLGTSIYICIHISDENELNIYSNKNTLSKKLSENILNQIKLVHYNNIKYKEVIENLNIMEISKSSVPIVFIEFSGIGNNIKWLEYNEKSILDAIYYGIREYFSNK